MPIPLINPITGLFVLEEDKLMLPYNPLATNPPFTSWACSGLPAGLSINTTTGVISGTPTTAGRSTATLTATNATGASLPVDLFFTVLAAPPADDEGLIDLNFDLQTGEITNPAITSGPQTYGKNGDVLGYNIGMVRAGVLRTMDLTNVKVTLRDTYQTRLVTLYDAAPASPLNPAAPRYRVIFDMASTDQLAAIKATIAEHEGDGSVMKKDGKTGVDNELAAMCEMEFTYTITTIGAVAEVVRTTKTFAVHLAKSLD